MIYGRFIFEKGRPMPYEWYKSKMCINRTMDFIEIEIIQN